MFRVFLRKPNKSQWELAVFVELDASKPFNSASTFVTAGGVMSNEPHLRNYLEHEAADPLLARDAIELWANLTQDESASNDWLNAPKLVAHEEALALYPTDDRTTRGNCY